MSSSMPFSFCATYLTLFYLLHKQETVPAEQNAGIAVIHISVL